MATSSKKAASLNDLIGELPSPAEFKKLLERVRKVDDRATVLVLVAMIDTLLERIIALYFVDLSKERYEGLFHSNGAPLGTLSAKIALGHAMGIYTAEFRSQLERIRKIRNVFAHSALSVDFSHAVISREAFKFDINAIYPGAKRPNGFNDEKAGHHFFDAATRIAFRLTEIWVARLTSLHDGVAHRPVPLPYESMSPPA